MKNYHRIITTLIISLLFPIIGSVVSAQSNDNGSELSEIKGLLYQYFDLIYESKSKNELQNLSPLVNLTSEQIQDEIKKTVDTVLHVKKKTEIVLRNGGQKAHHF